MKKSELIRLAMMAVAESESLTSAQMVDIIVVLEGERSMAQMMEKVVEEAQASASV